MQITKALAAPIPVTIAGREFTMAPLRLGQIARAQAWAQSRLANPLVAVMEALNSPGELERDRQATADLLAFRQAEAKAIGIEKAKAAAENREPNEAAALLTVPMEVQVPAERAREAKEQRQNLIARAYSDVHSPPTLGDRRLSSIISSMEGRAFEIWLSLQAHHAGRFRRSPGPARRVQRRSRRTVPRPRQPDQPERPGSGKKLLAPLLGELKPGSGEAGDWSETLFKLLEGVQILPPQIAELTVPQWYALIHGGGEDEKSIDYTGPESTRRFSRNWRPASSGLPMRFNRRGWPVATSGG